MNVFETCFPKKRSDIYLPEDDDGEESSGKICCCFNFRGNNKQGLIQLPTNNYNSRQTIDDYLDPRSPVSIEVLLQEQEEELDHYYGQTDDEDTYHGIQKKTNALDLNFGNTNFSFFEEEDAQFLSEHRISAILVDRPKLSSAHIFTETSDNMVEQELLDVVVPTRSTSTGSVSNRIFAFKLVQPEEDVEAEGEGEGEGEERREEIENNTQIPLSSSPQELTSISTNFKPFNSSVSRLSASSSTSTISNPLPPISNTSVQPLEQQLVDGKAKENSKSVSPVGLSDSSLSNYKATAGSQYQQQKHGDFPATTLTRVPYHPLPPLQISPPSFSPSSSQSHNIIKPQASTSTLSSSLPTTQYPHRTGRRPSLVTTAQSLLGDKLDDFTEKLAFIKKNIIMSMDSDDEEDDEEEHSNRNHYYNTEQKSQPMYYNNRNRAGSVGKSDGGIKRLSRSSMNGVSPLPPRTSSIANSNQHNKGDDYGNDSNYDDDDDDDEMFDFSKVVAISKNVRTFGEGVMDNGLRMFNNLSTRIKNAQHQHQVELINSNGLEDAHRS